MKGDAVRWCSPRAACALLLVLIGLLVSEPLYAVPARPVLEPLTQPDGMVLWVRQVGDEWLNGLRTHDGYTILLDEVSGFWVYAEPAIGGGLQPSPLVVGRDQPTGIPKRLPLGRAPVAGQPGLAPEETEPAVNLGSQPVLVIFVNFTPSARVGSTAASLNSKFFGASVSVKHYYEEVSYRRFTMTPAAESDTSLGGAVNDGIVSITLGYAHPNTGSATDDRNRTITRDALIAANPFVNFAAFDSNGDATVSATELHIVIIVAGYERSFSSSPCGASVWGHRWVLSGAVPVPVLDGKTVGSTYTQFGEWHCATSSPPGNAATIGIMVHELGHDLGLPDLYDTDGSSEGIGAWGVMGGGSWNQVSQLGDSPAHMDPWSKYAQGWITPTLVSGTLTNEPISQAATAADVYQLLSGNATTGEYFLVENRQKVGYDAGLPGAGLLIWHIDAAKAGNTDECYPGGPSCAVSHYKVAVVQADNLYDLEKGNDRGDTGDPWPGSTGKTAFSAASSPSSNLYNGTASRVSVTSISSSASTMTATLSVGGDPSLALSLNATSFRPGNTLILTATVTPGATPRTVDAYVAVQLPGGALFFLLGDGTFTTEIRPIVAGWTVASFSGEIFRYTFSGAEPVGNYTWYGAFTEPGTLNLIGPIVSAPFTFSFITVIFQDDMESGPGSWVPQAPWGQTTATSHSPTHSWTDSPSGNYGNDLNVSLFSPTLNFSGFTSVTLTFWHRYDLKSGYDFGNVWVTTDNGATWTLLRSFYGTNTTWQQATVNLNAFSGRSTVQIAFQLLSDFSVTGDGWYIDDVVVSGSQ